MNNLQVLQGLHPKKLLGKIPLITSGFIYLFALLNIVILYEIDWYDNHTPLLILFGGYRETTVTQFASIVSFLFFLKFLLETYWLTQSSRSFYNSTTMKILSLSGFPSLNLYLNYSIWRISKLIMLNLLFILPLIIGFYLNYGILNMHFLYQGYILIIGSVLTILLFDVYFFSFKNANAASTFVILTAFLVPGFVSLISTLLMDLSNSDLYLKSLNLLPDIITINYQYSLKSLSGPFNQSKITIPLFTIAGLLLLNLKLSKKLYGWVSK